MSSTMQPLSLLTIFPGDGEMAERCRVFPWEHTALGPPQGWSAALRTTVRTALESPFPMNLWCGSDLLLVYNDAYRHLLGVKHPDALGQPGGEVWQEVWSEVEPLIQSARREGMTAFQERARFLMQRKDGQPGEAFFAYAVSPVRDDDGSVVAVLNVALETTGTVRAEGDAQEARLAAEQAERRLRTVFEQAPAFLAVLSGAQHEFEFANDAYYELVGKRELIGRRVVDAIPELRGQGFVELLDHVLHTGEAYVGRAIPITLHRDGGIAEENYLDFVYQALTDSHGARTGIVAFGSNVTDAVRSRREAERLLRESERARADAEASEARYRFLASAIPVHVWSATPDGALDFVNERTKEFLGIPEEGIIGDAWIAALHPDDVARSAAAWSHAVATGEPYEIEFRIWSVVHGAHRWHLVRASAQRDGAGRILRWFGTNTDIDDWKSAQAELQRLTSEAQEANRSKSDFLAAMSHELRTPLNAIGGYAQLIELGVRGPVTAEQKTDLRRIQKSKSHLDGLVSGVLDFAKLGAGHIELRIVSIDVDAMMASVVDMVMPQMDDKGLTLEPLVSHPGLSVVGDVDKTRQILLNLLGNALKFTPAGGRITVTIEPEDRAVQMRVRDTGIGIAPEQLDRIFEPFVQAKSELHVAGIGVGLGLAISRQLARAMRGDVGVTSTPGAGSTFTLTLPR